MDILLIDDSPRDAFHLMELLATLGHAARHLADPTATVGHVAQRLGDPTLVLIIDLVMPNQDGIELMQSLRNAGCRNPIIIASNHEEIVIDQAHRLGKAWDLDVVAALPKPVSRTEMAKALNLARRAA